MVERTAGDNREPLDAATVRDLLEPDPELAARIQAFLREQLGEVLPPDPARGVEDYYERVVLGPRAAEALAILERTPRPSGQVVDVGCGLGSFVLLARQVGVDAIGLEPGAEEVELARARAAARGLPEQLFLHGVGERLPFADGESAAVLLQDVLEHVADWRGVVDEALRILAPGGVLYVKSPSYSGIRFLEPHYLTFWAPMLPRPLARVYLRARGRDVSYFDNDIHYLRRGRVLADLRRRGLDLSFPRLHKLEHPETVNRPWARRLVRAAAGAPGPLASLARLAAENPLQSVVDVVAHKPVSP